MSRIFISYRRADSEGYVGRIYDYLVQHFDKQDIFMDVDNILPGEDFVQVIENAVSGCDAVIVVIGPQWLQIADESGQRRLDQWNDFVRLEIVTALKENKLVIPVLIQQATMPRPDQLPEDLVTLTRRNAIVITHQSFSHDAGKLVKAVQSLFVKQSAHKISSAEVQAKAEKLKTVRDAIVNFTGSSLYQHRNDNRYFPVLGEGNPDARLLFIGEAPGKSEVAQGRPFIGPSGDILNELLASIGLKRDDIYITNILKDRPPENRDPSPLEIEQYAPFLEQEIAIIQPDVIVTLGRFSMEYILRIYDAAEKKQTITQLHGKLIKTQASYGQIHIMPQYHPALALYTASKKEVIKQDFQKLKLFI